MYKSCVSLNKKNMRNKIKKILEDYKGKNIAFNVDGEKQ